MMRKESKAPGDTGNAVNSSGNLQGTGRGNTKKKRKLPQWNLLILVLSLAGAYAGAYLVVRIFGDVIGTAGILGHVIWHVLFFGMLFLGGFLGVNLGMRLSVRYRICRRSFWTRSFAIAAVAIVITAAVGQVLFSITIETTSEITETTDGADIVLLLDGSGSQGKSDSDYGIARTQAVTNFVEALDEDDCVQAIVFAATVLPEQTELLTMNDAGKAEIIDCVSSINSVGRTDFDDALEAALDTLGNGGRSDSNKVIILLTDGDGALSDSVSEECKNSGVVLCTVRTTNDSKTAEGKAVAALAMETGGTDTVLSLGTDGSADATKMTLAFQEAVNTAAGAKSNRTSHITLDDVRLAGSGHTSLYQFVIRTIVLFALMVLIGFGYFGTVTPRGALKELPGAVALSLLVTISGNNVFTIVMLILFLGPAFVTLEVEDGKDQAQSSAQTNNAVGGLDWSESPAGEAEAAGSGLRQMQADEGDVIDV